MLLEAVLVQKAIPAMYVQEYSQEEERECPVGRIPETSVSRSLNHTSAADLFHLLS